MQSPQLHECNRRNCNRLLCSSYAPSFRRSGPAPGGGGEPLPPSHRRRLARRVPKYRRERKGEQETERLREPSRDRAPPSHPSSTSLCSCIVKLHVGACHFSSSRIPWPLVTGSTVVGGGRSRTNLNLFRTAVSLRAIVLAPWSISQLQRAPRLCEGPACASTFRRICDGDVPASQGSDPLNSSLPLYTCSVGRIAWECVESVGVPEMLVLCL